jgi:hypothetical protein
MRNGSRRLHDLFKCFLVDCASVSVHLDVILPSEPVVSVDICSSGEQDRIYHVSVHEIMSVNNTALFAQKGLRGSSHDGEQDDFCSTPAW